METSNPIVTSSGRAASDIVRQVKSSQGYRRPSIFEEVERVKIQVEYPCLGNFVTRNGEQIIDESGNRVTYIDPMYDELCLIIAEINLLKPDSAVTVAGIDTIAFIVQEVYTRLQCGHLRAVFESFQRVSWAIKHRKAYLRTALYNIVFEYESGLTNEASCTP